MTDDFIERVTQMRFGALRKAGLSEDEALAKMEREIDEQRAENERRKNDPPPKRFEDLSPEHQERFMAQLNRMFGPPRDSGRLPKGENSEGG